MRVFDAVDKVRRPASVNASLYSVCAWVERDLAKEALGVDEYGISYSSACRRGTRCRAQTF